MNMHILGVIIGREYTTRVKKKSFIILTFVVPLLFAALCMETIHCCRRIVRHKRKEGRLTRFERAVLAVAISLSVAIMLCGAWFFITQMTDTNPWISQMQPILNSPLLSVHVAIIAVAYLLLLMAFALFNDFRNFLF